ncbi:hypothetical protein chiPu_0025602 [Chiloscyllium punctatum]|uniref:Uncharacterized protein n=1 Tax=Chiloscyllium punctatum TaxID=137246 RepID=A0A401TGP4_CHIPU|nr:hypothetical protein [Chiloscyllium punctatum]
MLRSFPSRLGYFRRIEGGAIGHAPPPAPSGPRPRPTSAFGLQVPPTRGLRLTGNAHLRAATPTAAVRVRGHARNQASVRRPRPSIVPVPAGARSLPAFGSSGHAYSTVVRH